MEEISFSRFTFTIFIIILAVSSTIYNEGRTTYHYGGHGFADKVDMPGSEETNNYKFDDKGNWIERITYAKEDKLPSKITYIITRKYEYK